MGNTANNNWPYPESTDLVKDGATAIENLADAIDTTLGVFTPSTPGLSLISTTSFSGVTSISVNDVFSTTYENYLIKGNNIQASAGNITMRMRVSGTDNSSSNYNREYVIANGASLSANADNATTSWTVGNAGSSQGCAFEIQLNSPFTSTNTNGLGTWSLANATAPYWLGQSYGMTVTTSYTGFTLINANNMTGSVSVYGFNK
jgi:hypothetical protein